MIHDLKAVSTKVSFKTSSLFSQECLLDRWGPFDPYGSIQVYVDGILLRVV